MARLQRGLEALYRVDTCVAVEDFLIDAQARAQFPLSRRPREQLLVAELNGELQLGLFVEPAVLANLERHDPATSLDERNLDDFLLTLEGVSHFVYLVWRARADQSVSALELELQAEVDKYVTCQITMDTDSTAPAALRARLFDDAELAEDLDDAERERYRLAMRTAHGYAERLYHRYVRRGRYDLLFAELRRFYRLPLAGKLSLASRG